MMGFRALGVWVLVCRMRFETVPRNAFCGVVGRFGTQGPSEKFMMWSWVAIERK